MIINSIIIEDEPLAVEKLSGFISQVSSLRLLQSFDNAVDAIGYVKNNPVDLIFLDVHMPKLNGIQFLESLTELPQVIIVSAYDQYALKGYEFSVTDYLLKPYSFERFVKSVDKVLEMQKFRSQNQGNPIQVHDEILFVKSGNRIERIRLDEILFVQGMKDYLKIVTGNVKTMTLHNFREIEKVLQEPDFVRIHKSYIVAVKKIESIERNRITIAGQLLPISDTFKDHFYEILRHNKHLI